MCLGRDTATLSMMGGGDGKGEGGKGGRQLDPAQRAALLARAQAAKGGKGAAAGAGPGGKGGKGVPSLGQLVAMLTSKGIEKERIKDILLKGPTAENAAILQVTPQSTADFPLELLRLTARSLAGCCSLLRYRKLEWTRV